MHALGFSPNASASLCIMRACGTITATDGRQEVPHEIVRQQLPCNNRLLGNSRMDVNAMHVNPTTVQKYLETLPPGNLTMWNDLIFQYIQEDQAEQALDVFKYMQQKGIPRDALTFVCVLKACGTFGAIQEGREIHDEIARYKLVGRVGNALVNMYAKCGALGRAKQVFEELPLRTIVSWTALITGYAQHGEAENALSCLESMQCEGLIPNELTFSCILKACGTIRALEKGVKLHSGVLRQGLLGNNVVLGTALVDMYAKCGALTKAQLVLEELSSRDVIAWTALIAGFAEQGQAEEALSSLLCMQSEGIPPNAVTFSCILKAFGTAGALQEVRKIHDEMVGKGLLGSNIVLGNALVDAYAQCCALTEARQVLEKLPRRDVISWNGLIAGYVKHGQAEEALICFKQMQWEGSSPNTSTYSCILKACGATGDIEMGKQIHDGIIRQGLLENSVVLGAALVDMYVKCGDLTKAEQALEELQVRDVFSWTALITGYAEQGRGKDVLNAFERMQCDGVLPNAATFSCVFIMCSHLGLVEVGHMYYADMKAKFGIQPNLEHYTCMVDLFGRAGHLEKAVGMIEEMPSANYSAAWHALLGACRKWGNVKVGRWAFDKAIQGDRKDGAAYTLMANIYAAAGMEESAKSIETMRTENKAWDKG